MDEARRLYNKQWRANNRERMRQKALDYYYANKDSMSRKSAAWSKANPDRVKSNDLKRMYGIDLDQFYTLLETQQSRCAICSIAFTTTKDAHVDHCHTTNQVRGLLCGNCNRWLGLFKDDPTLLTQAITYLAGAVGIEPT